MTALQLDMRLNELFATAYIPEGTIVSGAGIIKDIGIGGITKSQYVVSLQHFEQGGAKVFVSLMFRKNRNSEITLEKFKRNQTVKYEGEVRYRLDSQHNIKQYSQWPGTLSVELQPRSLRNR